MRILPSWCVFVCLTLLVPVALAEQARILGPVEAGADVTIFRHALEEIHPQLYRSSSKPELDQMFEALARDARQGFAEGEFFKRISQVAVAVHCGHTFCNLMNQEDAFIARVFDQRVFAPFYFRLIADRLIVTQNLSDDERMAAGTEIVALNGHRVTEIIQQLLSISKSDGLNTLAHRRAALELLPAAAEERFLVNLFDVYYPLFFPLVTPQFQVTARAPGSAPEFRADLPALTRRERWDRARTRFGPLAPPEESWQFSAPPGGTAFLKMGTFFTYGWKRDPAQFLEHAFETIRRAGCPALIVDLRGNVGGLTQNATLLKRYLAARPIPESDGSSFVVKSLKLDPALAPYVKTYEDWMKQALGAGLPEQDYRRQDDGRFVFVKPTPIEQLEPFPLHFQGKTYFLADGWNASAASEFLQDVRREQLGLIVGQATGGNRQGINGGVFFLKLPNSRIEVDVPFGAHIPATPAPDEGVQPDIRVEPSVTDIQRGIDTEQRYVRETLIGSTSPQPDPGQPR